MIETNDRTGIKLTAEDLKDLIIAYDATNEIKEVANALLNSDTSVSTTPDGKSIVGRLNRIWNVIYRHSRFYDGIEAVDGHEADGCDGHGVDEIDLQLGRFHALEEYLEHPTMDIDERVRGVFGV